MAFTIHTHSDSETVLLDDEHPAMRVVITGPDALALGRALRDALPLARKTLAMVSDRKHGGLTKSDQEDYLHEIDNLAEHFGEG